MELIALQKIQKQIEDLRIEQYHRISIETIDTKLYSIEMEVFKLMDKVCEDKADGTNEKDLRVCEVIASASDPLERKSLIDLGFKEMPHFTVAHSLMYPLGRHRHLSAGCVGTPNEMLWICETDDQNDKSITEIICLHNYDYDGYLTIKKVIAIINSILCKSHF